MGLHVRPCLRCHDGKMVWETYVTQYETFQWPPLGGWRCINCGDLVDQVIMAHRTRQQDQSEFITQPRLRLPVYVCPGND